MNVLDALKDTILNVPKDLSSGIKSLTSPSETVTAESDKEDEEDYVYHIEGGINYDAGAELLSKFQGDWKNLHQKSEDNAKRAKAVDSLIGDLSVNLERQNEAVNQFLMEISQLPQLLTNLQGITEKIESLEGEFSLIEADLLTLEDVCEEQELIRNRTHHQYQLQTYRQRRNTELEQAKVELAKRHAVKVQRYEQHLQHTLRERQQAFEETFREEIQHYKTHGKPSPMLEAKLGSEVKPETLIEFVPEEDSSALDKFLDADEREPPDSPVSSPTEQQTEESTDSEQESTQTTDLQHAECNQEATNPSKEVMSADSDNLSGSEKLPVPTDASDSAEKPQEDNIASIEKPQEADKAESDESDEKSSEVNN